MSTLVAMVVVVIVLGMLVAYQLGYATGRREGIEAGRHEGKREGAVRAYAVGYDRGRHDRQASPADESGEPSPPATASIPLWLAILIVVGIVMAAVLYSQGFLEVLQKFPSS